MRFKWIEICFLVSLLFLASCAFPAVMTDDDLARWEAKLDAAGWSEEDKGEFMDEIEARTMSPEEYEAWSQETAQATGDIVEALIPGPVDEPLGDLASMITAALLGVGTIGGGAYVTQRKMKNSKPGKLFGPLAGPEKPKKS